MLLSEKEITQKSHSFVFFTIQLLRYSLRNGDVDVIY